MGLKLVPIKAYTTDGKQQYILVPHNADGASFAKHAHAIGKCSYRKMESPGIIYCFFYSEFCQEDAGKSAGGEWASAGTRTRLGGY